MVTVELTLLANLLIKQNDRGTFLFKGLIGCGAICLRRYTIMDRIEFSRTHDVFVDAVGEEKWDGLNRYGERGAIPPLNSRSINHFTTAFLNFSG